MKKVLLVSALAIAVALTFYLLLLPEPAAGWGPRPRPMPRPQPPVQPRPQPNPNSPKPDSPKPSEPEEPVPGEIPWADTSDTGMNNDQISETKFWDHFTDMGEKKATKPVMIYFYWPQEDEADDKVENMIRRCNVMEENIFSHEAVRKASLRFHCMKCNFKDDMGENLRKKYKVTIVPKVLFFDVKGRKVWQLTSTKAKPEGVAKKMEKIAKDSRKLLEQMNK